MQYCSNSSGSSVIANRVCQRSLSFLDVIMALSGLQQLNGLIAELEIIVGSSRKVSNVETSTEIVAETKIFKAKVEKISAEPRTKEIPLADEISINSLDLRVGVIRSVVRHQTAEKLYCEEIDVGEEVPRPIASGLVPFYSLDQMQDRRVIVVANLLPRKLVGFKSNGMVLCASKIGEDGVEIVEFIDPPVSSAPGDKIIGFGLSSSPLSAKQCDKRKAFDTIAELLIVDKDGIAYWNGIRLVAQSTGDFCSAPTLRDCHIH